MEREQTNMFEARGLISHPKTITRKHPPIPTQQLQRNGRVQEKWNCSY